MPVKSYEIVPLIKAASRKAAEARETGDKEGYEYWRDQLERLARIHAGFGTAEDELEIEKAKTGLLGERGPLAMLGKFGGMTGFLLPLLVVALLVLRGKR